MNYIDTHVSRNDGSPAMERSSTDDQITLMNEDGYEWTDPRNQWIPIGTETDADYRRWNPEDYGK